VARLARFRKSLSALTICPMRVAGGREMPALRITARAGIIARARRKKLVNRHS